MKNGRLAPQPYILQLVYLKQQTCTSAKRFLRIPQSGAESLKFGIPLILPVDESLRCFLIDPHCKPPSVFLTVCILHLPVAGVNHSF